MVNDVPDVSPEIPPPTWRLVLKLLGRLPERALSRSFGRIADIPLPGGVRRLVLGSFARAVGIDLSEAARPLEEYPTLNAFFVRRLRDGARLWPSGDEVLASPVDGIVGRFGRVTKGEAIQAKGHRYPVGDLLGDDTEAQRFEGGSFLTIYLSPRHYHRIHTPCAGTIAAARYLPGALLPVNAPAVMHVPGLFARNERLLCYVDGVMGRVAVVAVGAYNVGRISAAFDPDWVGTPNEPWVTNRRPPAPLRRSYEPPKRVETGEELMAFHLGSTVVLLFEPAVQLRADLQPGLEVRLGEPIME
ncbi:MAG: archaetidylserine decarboxylase [Gemmatimonadota bacterium]